MARDIVLDVITSLDERGLKKAADGFDKLANQVDKAGETLGDSGEKAEEAGEKFGEAAAAAGHLERKLDDARRRVKELAAEFDRTGDADALKAWRGASRELAGLERVFKSLGNEGSDGIHKATAAVEGLEKGAGKVRKAFADALDSMPKEVKVAVAIVGAAGAVATGGAAASAGILAGLGLGALGAGVALSLKDERVDAAIGDLGEKISTRVRSAAEGAFAVPVIAATKALDGAFDRVAPRIERIFSGLAPMVEPLARGLGGFFDKAMPGIEKTVNASKPLLDSLARHLPKMGEAVDSFMDSIADGGPGALRFFDMLLRDVEAFIKGTGNVIEVSSKMFESIMDGMGKMVHAEAEAFGWMPWVGDRLRETDANWQKWNADLDYSASAAGLTGDSVESAMGRISGSTSGAAAQVGHLQQKFEDLFSQTMTVDQATIAYEASIDDLSESIRENGRSFADSTEKGRANHEALLAVVSRAKELRDANIAAGMGADQANAKYNAQIAALEGVLRKAGLTKQQISDLIEEYKRIPTGPKIIEVKLRYTVSGKQVLSNRSGKVEAFAEGGTTPVNRPFLVGENGPELMQLGARATVTPLSDGAGYRPPVGAMGGGRTTRLVIDSAGSRFDELLLEVLRTAVRTRGGDVQLVIGGS